MPWTPGEGSSRRADVRPVINLPMMTVVLFSGVDVGLDRDVPQGKFRESPQEASYIRKTAMAGGSG